MTKIKLGEVEYNLTFNMGFLKMLFKEYGIDPLNLTSLTGAQYFDLATAVIYCGILATCKKEKTTAPDKDVTEGLIDELHPNTITTATSALFTWMQTPEETLDKSAKKEDGSNAGTFHMEQA